jgi:hypothetical protein
MQTEERITKVIQRNLMDANKILVRKFEGKAPLGEREEKN